MCIYIVPSENEYRELSKIIISNLLEENSSRSTTTIRILFRLLRTTNILNASENCRSAYEKNIDYLPPWLRIERAFCFGENFMWWFIKEKERVV